MINKIEKSKESIALESDMDISLANALRRSVNEIPILAIDEVDIYRNDSALYDEIIAHRFGLVPLKNEKIQEKEKEKPKQKKDSEDDFKPPTWDDSD